MNIVKYQHSITTNKEREEKMENLTKEIVYVRSIQDYYLDQEGRSYFRSGKYVYRMDDNKLFMFYK